MNGNTPIYATNTDFIHDVFRELGAKRLRASLVESERLRTKLLRASSLEIAQLRAKRLKASLVEPEMLFRKWPSG